MGLIVKDIEATQARMESMGVRIIKKTGELDLSGDTEDSRILGGLFGIHDLKGMQEEIRGTIPAIELIGFKGWLVAADPDGNLFEIQPEVGGPF